MARNSPQQNSSGFWDTYNDRLDVQEYKKPSTCEEYISGKKKTKSNKKAKPSPALASLLFTTSKDEASGNTTHTQYEAPSGPNAWSMKAGSALFKGELPENQRRGSSSGYNGAVGRYDPYYPEPLAEPEELGDEEELMRKAIEESMRTAQEEQARKKRQEKEEEEWLSKVCAELKSEDKKPNWMQKYAVDITDDDFVPFTVEEPKPKPKPKPLTTSSISSMKNTDTKKKQTDSSPKENVERKQNWSSKANVDKKQDWSLKENVEKKRESKENVEKKEWSSKVNVEQKQEWSSKANVDKKQDWSSKANVEQKQTNWKTNVEKKQDWSSKEIIEKSPKKEAHKFEKPPLRDPYQEERKETRISHANSNIRSFTNMYDDYDDDGSESEEPDVTTRQTYWHPQNQSHKWNQETWGGQNRTHNQRGGKQESWNDRLSNLRSAEDKLVDNGREAPKEQRARSWKHDNAHSNAKSKDFHQNEHNGSPQKSRNFKVDFYKIKQNAEAQFELDNKSVNDFKKHVQFQRVEQSSSSESELGAIASNFAVSKISFDENLYSSQAQRSKTPAHTQKVNAVSKPNVSTVPRNNGKEYSSDERDSKHNASTNSRYKPPQSNNQTGSKQSVGPTTSPNNAGPMNSNKPNVGPNSWKHKVSSPEPLPVLANEDMDQLEENIKDMTLDSISSGPLSPSSVRDELRAEVHLPQDNQIYNFYLNKQLGRANTQDQTDPYKLPSNDQTHAEPLPNTVQSDPYNLPSNAADVNPYPSNALAQPDLYQLPNVEGRQVPYKLPDNKPAPNSSLDAFMTNYVTMETERQLPAQPLPSYPPVSSLSSAPIMSSVPFSPYINYPPPPPRHDVYGFNHFLSSQSVPYPHYPTTSTPLPPQPSSSWRNIPNPPASWIASTPTPTHTPWSTSVPPPVPHTPWTNSSPWPPTPASAPPTLGDNALWRHLLAQAQHNPRLLEEMITSLNKSTSECNDPEQLSTLYAMSLEVDAAVQKLQRSVHEPEELATAAVGEDLVPPDPEQDKSAGRGRGGKREPSRDHVKSCAGMGRGRGYMPS